MLFFVWIIRIVFENQIFFYVSIFLVGLFSVLVSIPLNSNIFEKGEKRDTLSASMYRNSTNMFANFILFGILAIAVNIFNISFMVAAVCMLFIVMISYLFSEEVLFREKSIWERIFR